jgi:hypothetical protein
MSYILLNLLPIGAAALAGLAVLFLLAPTRPTVPKLAGALLGLAWLAAILAGALILAPVTAGGWTIALGSAFIIWVGFVLPALAIALVLREHSPGTALADTGRWLAIMLAQAAVLHIIGLVRPG